MRCDTFTTSPDDAAHFEQVRGESYEIDSRPDAAEILRDTVGLPDGGEHDCGREGCLVCGLARVLDRMRAL